MRVHNQATGPVGTNVPIHNCKYHISTSSRVNQWPTQVYSVVGHCRYNMSITGRLHMRRRRRTREWDFELAAARQSSLCSPSTRIESPPWASQTLTSSFARASANAMRTAQDVAVRGCHCYNPFEALQQRLWQQKVRLGTACCAS